MPVLPQLSFWQTKMHKDVIFPWPGTNASIPWGYTRETALDGRFPKMVATSATNGGGTSGSDTHADHPGAAHTHSVDSAHASTNTGDSNNFFAQSSSGSNLAHQVHNHPVTWTSRNYVSGAITGSFNFNSTSSNPPYFEVIFVKSTGITSGVPNTALTYWNTASPPTGWRACDGVSGAPDLRNRFMRGAATAGNGGGTGGTSDAHSHTAPTHTHVAVNHDHTVTCGTTGGGGNESAGGPSVANGHNHNGSTTTSNTASTSLVAASASTTANGDGQPSWFKLYTIQNNSGGPSHPIDIIAIWLGTVASIPVTWKLCDGTNGTPDIRDKFIKGLNTTGELGNTGGATTHTHATGTNHVHTEATHSHTITGSTSGQSAGANANAGTAFNSCTVNHSHTWGSSGSTASVPQSAACAAGANTVNRPLTTDVIYIQYKQA